MITASIFSKFWSNLVEHDEQGLFLVLTGFILSFAFIRMSTRLMRSPKVPWWPGSVVSDSGVHLHHLVFGIVTMMIAGTLGFAAFGHSPYTEICAFLFGVGAGLTIDEFALWVQRFHPDRRTERFKNAFRDIVGGRPDEGVAHAKEEVLAAGREAAAEVRQQAERVARSVERPGQDD
ncbi:MAG TPA: hypothetical protein VNY83_07070 [Solirubrobacterales bacterium]|jgi:hypothetical protein|nr:hypothetical protein [Solirubrobacterales bacterium]